MELTIFGLSHHYAPLEVRERWAHSRVEASLRLRQIRARIAPSEHLVLSTCNRTEFYSRLPKARTPLAAAADPASARRALAEFYMGPDSFKASDLEHFYLYREDRAVEHLFRLAGGLDSMIVGETEILRQLKDAYAVSQDAGSAGRMFHRLFPAALKVGKAVRRLTGISRGCITPGQAALHLATEALGEPRPCSLLVVGSGKIATLTARAILDAGISCFRLVNRTPENAHEMVDSLLGPLEARRSSVAVEILEWDRLEAALEGADVVISSTGSTVPLVDRDVMTRIVRGRGGRPLAVIDLAVPRDFDPEIEHCEGVRLFNIDSLNQVIQENIRQRSEHIPRAESIVRDHMKTFVGQLMYLEVEPIIRHMVERFEEIRLGEVQATIDRFPPEHHAHLQELTRSLVGKLLDFPISRLKAIRRMGNLSEDEIAFLKRLFPLDPD